MTKNIVFHIFIGGVLRRTSFKDRPDSEASMVDREGVYGLVWRTKCEYVVRHNHTTIVAP